MLVYPKRFLMNRILFTLFFIFLFFNWNFSQTKSIVKITGFAPSYVGQTISVSEIEDYISMNEAVVATTTVSEDSTFTLSFYSEDIQKIVLRPDKNWSFLYIQPNSAYDIYIPEKDKYEVYRPNGNSIELTFFDLDTNDINYKILQFQRWTDEFVSNYYHLKNIKPLEFGAKMDEFKTQVEKAYNLSDTSKREITSTEKYFLTFVKFSIASLDNVQFAAERNRYEKHDFYIKHNPVEYKNDAYMAYINAFYDKTFPRLSTETNNSVYKGLLKSSPTLIMRALGGEYTLINLRIREMVMIKALSEEYYSKDMPQTNILTVLDSVSNHSMFAANAIIARNMMNRLTQLVQGGKAPDFVLKNAKGETKTISKYSNKHLYIHFYDPSSIKNTMELEPLIKMYDTYKKDITFITIYPDKEYDSTVLKKYIDVIPWESYKVSSVNSIWKNYKIETYPSYVLIDAFGYVVAAPALGPMPDGQYQTIDKTFFYIQKLNSQMKEGQ